MAANVHNTGPCVCRLCLCARKRAPVRHSLWPRVTRAARNDPRRRRAGRRRDPQAREPAPPGPWRHEPLLVLRDRMHEPNIYKAAAAKQQQQQQQQQQHRKQRITTHNQKPQHTKRQSHAIQTQPGSSFPTSHDRNLEWQTTDVARQKRVEQQQEKKKKHNTTPTNTPQTNIKTHRRESHQFKRSRAPVPSSQ
jgi:hypothetical protein